jgi:hypothetical protein
LPRRAAELATAPTVLSIRLLSMAIGAASVAEGAVPRVVPRLVRRVAH